MRACVLIQESSDKKKVISVERRSWRTASLLNGWFDLRLMVYQDQLFVKVPYPFYTNNI
jgi:hypothetical protein